MPDRILTLIKATKLRIGYFLILMLGGFWISPLWSVFLAVWLGISLFWTYTKQDQVLSVFEKKVYNFSLYFYPILGTLIKVYIYLDKFPGTYFWVNRFEHTLWAMALVVLLLPFWKWLWVGLKADKILKQVQDDTVVSVQDDTGEIQSDKSEVAVAAIKDRHGKKTAQLLALFMIVVGVICLFGNMVEFVEYGFRVLGHLDYKYALYYPDTIYDMMSNVVGATLGFLVVIFAFGKMEKDVKIQTEIT